MTLTDQKKAPALAGEVQKNLLLQENPGAPDLNNLEWVRAGHDPAIDFIEYMNSCTHHGHPTPDL